MLSWRGFFKKFRKYDGMYDWTRTSDAFYRILKRFIKKTDNILEFGSSTGHISYRLAKDDYTVTLLDIRREPIEIAKNNFKKKNLNATFICADIFDCTNKYDIAWSSGLIHCYNDEDKAKLIKKLADITNRVLLFYPDVDNPNKKRGTNEHILPGVGGAKEYEIKRIPEIIYDYFDEIYFGLIEKKKIGFEYDMYWVFAQKR